MAESEEAFRVTDRRRQADDEPAPASSPPRAEEARRPAPPPAPPPPPPSGVETAAGRSLVGLFMMLASSAVIALGDASDPATGQSDPDPLQAAELIELLVLLREKTEGHLTPDEAQLLGELIYDLQLRYVRVTRPSR